MRHVQATHGFVQAVVYRAVDQAIRVLHGGDAGQAQLLGHSHKLVHAVRGFVGQANGAHFASLDQATQCFQLLLHGDHRQVFGGVEIHIAKRWHVARGPVDLVKVNHVGLQAFERGVARLDDVRRGQAIGAAIADPVHATGWAGQLGGQYQFLPGSGVLGEPVADDGLGRAIGLGAGGHGVHLGRVDEVDAALQRAVQNRVGRGLVHLLAEGHGAQANRGDVQVAAAKLYFFHGDGFGVRMNGGGSLLAGLHSRFR